MRGQDSNLRPPGYEPDEIPLLHPAHLRTADAEDRGRTGTILSRSRDFKSLASANSATPANALCRTRTYDNAVNSRALYQLS